ncbi:MAG: ExsB family transcriptional regulator [Candidatus Omnitrophica bacterium]|nr:ExsB family transcriptional regulator [Candidatus Omnitrophota bacterium]MCM8809188.1 ExsB family transcriptional regulator [Candidatus Omnitrophota bacterium]
MAKFSAKKFIKESVNELMKKIKDKRALVATSGGVDSTVCAILAKMAIGDNLVVFFIDDGLMREKEPEQVRDLLAKKGIDLEIWNVEDIFFEALKGKIDPEEKRKAFREAFYKVLSQAVRSYSVDFLIQGTIAADIIETQKGIKTQHNVLSQIGINPAFYGLTILEPLKELYKHQVRQVAKALGLPKKIYDRKPFPGPGLATRIIGEVTRDRVEKIRIATKIVEEELKEKNIFQAFPVLLSDKATGIVGGKRLLGDIISIRAVKSEDALTAQPVKILWKRLYKIRDRILKEVPDVVKVVYDITPKPPSTIEYI